MKKEIVKKLVEVGVFNQSSVSEEEYDKCNEVDDNILYAKSERKWDNGDVDKYFWRIDTKGLTSEEIDLLLKIKQIEDIGTIKKASIFFVVLTVISLLISIIGATSIANLF